MINRIRRWLLLDLTGIEYFSPTFYMADENRWYQGNWHRVINVCNGGKDDIWMCRVMPYSLDCQIGLSGAGIRRAYKPGLFWKPYLRLLETIGYRPYWSK